MKVGDFVQIVSDMPNKYSKGIVVEEYIEKQPEVAQHFEPVGRWRVETIGKKYMGNFMTNELRKLSGEESKGLKQFVKKPKENNG